MADCLRFKSVQSILAVVFYLISIGSFNLYAAESDAIIAGAQKAGELITWAVGEIPFQTMVVGRFKKKYPFIKKVDAVRIPSEKLRTRLITEAQTGKTSNVDILGVGGFELAYLVEKGFFATYRSPESNTMPDGCKDPNGRWSAYYVNTIVSAYNTRMVAARDVPQRWEDLLDAKWRGKISFFDEEYMSGTQTFSKSWDAKRVSISCAALPIRICNTAAATRKWCNCWPLESFQSWEWLSRRESAS